MKLGQGCSLAGPHSLNNAREEPVALCRPALLLLARRALSLAWLKHTEWYVAIDIGVLQCVELHPQDVRLEHQGTTDGVPLGCGLGVVPDIAERKAGIARRLHEALAMTSSDEERRQIASPDLAVRATSAPAWAAGRDGSKSFATAGSVAHDRAIGAPPGGHFSISWRSARPPPYISAARERRLVRSAQRASFSATGFRLDQAKLVEVDPEGFRCFRRGDQFLQHIDALVEFFVAPR